MDTQPVQQNVLNPLGAIAASASATDTSGNPAPGTPAAAFGALLALQLGAGEPAIAAMPGSRLPADDTLAPGDTTAEAATALAADPLAALNLPALLPQPAMAQTAPAAANTGNAASPQAATDGLPRAFPTSIAARDAGARAANPPQITAPSAPTAGADALRAGDTTTLRQAAQRAADFTAPAADAPAPNAFPAALTQAASVTATATPPQAALDARVGTPAWHAEFAQKIVWMVGDRLQSAEMHLNPPELGPLDIKLTIEGEHTTAVFSSPHGAVRDAVESALPRLREVLADSGLMLGNASVTADTPRDGQAFQAPHPGARGGERSGGAETPAPAAVTVTRSGRGLVDLFA
jgi:flagellar hook-length control protein FliK